MTSTAQPGAKDQRSQLATLLLTPWRATQGSSRWTVLAVMVVSFAAAIAMRVFMGGLHAWQVATLMYGFGAGFLFLMFSSVLLLALDARRLRLPGIQHAAVMSLLLYAALVIAVPVVTLSPTPALAPTVALLVAIVIAGVLAFMLLPRYLSLPMIFVPSIGLRLWHAAHLPTPGQPGFVGIGAAILVVLVLADALCWRRLLDGRWSAGTGLRNPSISAFHRTALGGDWSGLAQQTDSRLIRQRPNWLRVVADLHGVGPAAPVRSVRIALGGWYMPQTIGSTARQWLPAIFMLAAFAGMQAVVDPHHDMLAVWWRFGLKGLVAMTVLITLVLVALMPFALQQRWQRVNAELPLLALLPGLGTAASIRKHMLQASLGKPLIVAALMLVAVLGMGIAMHADALDLLLLAMPVVACAAWGIATVLCIVGGRPLASNASFMMGLGAFCLLCFGTALPLSAVGHQLEALPVNVVATLTAGWLAFGALLYWLGLRGWRGLQRRPHPFLANER